MASRNPNNDPPVFTSPLQRDEMFGFRIGLNEAADCTGITDDGNGAGVDHMPIAYSLLPDSPFPLGSMHRPPHSYTHNIPLTGLDFMTDVTQFNSFQNSQIDHNFLNIGGHMPFINNPVPGFPYSEGNVNVNGIYESDIHCNTGTADNVMSSATHLSSFQNPQIDQNFVTIRGNAAGGFQMTRQGGEKYSINIHRPQINRKFVSCGASTPVLYHTSDSGEIGINNNIEVSSVQSNCLEKTDGSFLTLGIGDSTEVKSKFNVPCREITSKNERAILPQLNTSHGLKASRSSLNHPGHNMAGGFSSFQNNVGGFSSFQNDVGGFSSLVHNVGGWTLSNNDLGVMCGTNIGLSSSPSNTLQTPPVDMQHCIPMPSNRNLVLGGNGDARFANTDPYKGVQGYPTAPSRPFSSSQSGLLDYGQVRLSGLTSESAKTTRIASQPSSDQLQKCLMKSVRNFSPESSMISPFIGVLGSTTSQDQSGQQFPAYQGSATQAAESGHFPKRIGVQTARQPFLASEASAARVAECGLFRKRIGVQLASSLGQTQDIGPVQHSKDLLRPAFTTGQVNPVAKGNWLTQASNVLVGPSLRRIAIQPPPATPATPAAFLSPVPSKDLFGSNLATGQVIPAAKGNRLAQASNVIVGPSLKKNSVQPVSASPVSLLSSVPSKNFLGPTFTIGPVIPVAKGNGFSQASSALVGQSLKRSAIRPLPAIPRVQRRKTMPQPSIRPSVPPRPQTAPFIPFPAQTAPALHIKRQGFDGLPQPIGQKCLLCRRDLSFTPEGPVYQPTIPPPVAVLPCGHVFHDHCLQLITPADQSKQPPCIPCAIGES